MILRSKSSKTNKQTNTFLTKSHKAGYSKKKKRKKKKSRKTENIKKKKPSYIQLNLSPPPKNNLSDSQFNS